MKFKDKLQALRKEKVIDFLCRAKKATYAGKGAENTSSRPNSHDLQYIENNLKYIDTYLGGEKFAGEEALWCDDSPFWSMNYIGRIIGLFVIMMNVPVKLCRNS